MRLPGPELACCATEMKILQGAIFDIDVCCVTVSKLAHTVSKLVHSQYAGADCH